MEKVLNVAQYIIDEYRKISSTTIDEMKLHKLLYLSQRECYAVLNRPMFPESFEGWRYGPVCKCVRGEFYDDRILCNTERISDASAYIVRNVLEQYGFIESWKLSQLTHREISWKNSRIGLAEWENGSVTLKSEDIMKDAERVRPYDSTWDMYYDEFDDFFVCD